MPSDNTPLPVQAQDLCLLVYAPFGDDYALSRYPGDNTRWRDHPLLASLSEVAASGVPVLAMLDLPGEPTRLLQIDPAAPAALREEICWKLDMAAAPSLSGLLQTALARYPGKRLALCLEGHGSGYLPAIDKAGLMHLHELGRLGDWQRAGQEQAPFDASGRSVYERGVPTLPGGGPTLPGGGPTLPGGGPTLPGGGPTLPGGGPTLPGGGPTLPGGGPTLPGGGPTLPGGGPTLPGGGPTLPGGGPTLPGGGPTLPGGGPTLPGGGPTLPGGGPTLPVSHASMPTWVLGQALAAGLQGSGSRLAVLHLANCFNMSVEVLHTVAPYADAASGYCSTNYFSGAASYPAVFRRLAQAGSTAAVTLAGWFVEENHRLLSQRGRHPLVGGALELRRMADVTRGVEQLSDALLQELRTTRHPRRSRRRIESAVVKAQQYDTSGDLLLEGPDQLTDLHSLAHCMARDLEDWPEVHTAALALCRALEGIKRVGDIDSPWMDDRGEIVWDFTDPHLAMNIFLPDPTRSGQWDWRTPFYVDINPGQGPARLQVGVVPFLQETNWVEFVREYHADTVFRAISVPGLFTVPTARHGVRPVPADRLVPGQRAARQAPVPGPIARRVATMLAKDDPVDD
ncbi:hypothetical protein [Ideonella alba]|uniref:Uncharacterized protein n=1 Tax=Ideonella alba TaxID=2824118 RepID=A0A940Y8Z5_9BURK|nr:hypothetical protein [Ideonella alba]MBQ0931063.1 hypothetical protein [Ideonella alba]